MELRHSLLLSIGGLIGFSNSLGSLSRESAFGKMRTAVRMAKAREGSSRSALDRRERMRPHVEKVLASDPALGVSTIAARLRQRESFRQDFPEARRTIEEDVRAIKKPGKAE